MKYIYIIFIAIFVSSCISNDNNETIDFSSSEDSGSPINTKAKTYIAIASMTSPKETFIYYKDLIEYVSKKLGSKLYLRQKKTYEEVNELLINGEVDFAFICSGAFADIYPTNKVRTLVIPQIEGKNTYNSLIITNKQQNYTSFSDLRNKSFAFTDPLSNTGRFYPLKLLKDLNVKDHDFFINNIYTYGHDNSIQMVNRGIVDGAAVHSLIFKYIKKFHPDRVNNIKIVNKSEDYGMPPIVTPKSLARCKYDQYQNIFLHMHEDSIGRKILINLNIDKFIIPQKGMYKSVMNLKAYIEDEIER